jgi:hypothetical protein
MHYSICAPADPSAASILAAVLAAFANDRQMKADLGKLNKSKPDRSKSDQYDVELNQLKLNKPGLSKPVLAKRDRSRRALACPSVRLNGKSSACCGKAECA